MKFLHTADWQIGMKAAHVGAGSGEVRRVRFESAERVVRIARERGADAMLVTGDTFEDNAVATVDVQRLSMGAPLEDLAIIAHSNKKLAAIGAAFEEFNIPTVTQNHAQFYRKAAINCSPLTAQRD